MAKAKPKEFPWENPEVVSALLSSDLAVMGAWILFSKYNAKANAMNNLIAMAEIIPAVDLNLPRGVVLAAMYDKTGDALEMMNQIAQAIKDLPDGIKTFVQETVDQTKEEIKEAIPDIPEVPVPEVVDQYVSVVKECDQNAKKNMGWSYGIFYARVLWIQSCMAQKGLKIGTDWIGKQIR